MALNADPGAISASARTMPTAPVVVGDLFGWYSPGLGRRGVILCGTYGYEQLAAHKPWRELAEMIAATGCATLRFDYPGEGDSGDAGAGQLAAWLDAIRAGIRHLREAAGAEEIVLVGLRLGGTLAALVAAEGGVDRLVLLAPFATGRAYLREIKLQALTIGSLPDGTPLPSEPGTLNVGGFLIGPELSAGLGAIDLGRAERAPAPEILLLGADVERLAARYRTLGAAVTSGPLPGLQALVSNPLFAQAPEEAFAAVATFAAEGARPCPDRLPRPPAPAILTGPGWREEPVRFGLGQFGILCRPAEPQAHAPTVLFVNCGTNAHPGWGRQTTALARRLAAGGCASLRLDLLGVGESAPRPDGASPLYNLDTVADVRAALDHLESRPEAGGPYVIAGTCSGAFLAFQAVTAEPRLRAAVAVNLFCFDWDPTQDVETVVRTGFRSAATYSNLMRQGHTWRRVLRGQVRVGAIATALARRSVTNLRRRLSGPLRPGASVARRVAALRQRGGELLLVFAAGEPGLAELDLHLGRTPAAVARHLGRPVAILEGADHNLSTPAAQARFAQLLEGLLAELREA